jgi:hypothetical protein
MQSESPEIFRKPVRSCLPGISSAPFGEHSFVILIAMRPDLTGTCGGILCGRADVRYVAGFLRWDHRITGPRNCGRVSL